MEFAEQIPKGNGGKLERKLCYQKRAACRSVRLQLSSISNHGNAAPWESRVFGMREEAGKLRDYLFSDEVIYLAEYFPGHLQITSPFTKKYLARRNGLALHFFLKEERHVVFDRIMKIEHLDV